MCIKKLKRAVELLEKKFTFERDYVLSDLPEKHNEELFKLLDTCYLSDLEKETLRKAYMSESISDTILLWMMIKRMLIINVDYKEYRWYTEEHIASYLEEINEKPETFEYIKGIVS